MNQDSEFTDDPRDGAASESDPLVRDELERRLRGMRPVAPAIDLAALVEEAHGPDEPMERANDDDANWLVRRKPAAEVIGVRSTRRFLPVVTAWLCGLAMGALAMLAVQKNPLPMAAAVGTSKVRKETQRDVPPAPHRDQGTPKSESANRMASDQVERSRDLPAVGGATRARDLASMLGPMRSEYAETGEVWWTGMFLRAGRDPFGTPRGEVPHVAVAVMDEVDDEANPAAMETPDLSTRPAPTRERLLRELQGDRSERVF